jgi:hypothetical protein
VQIDNAVAVKERQRLLYLCGTWTGEIRNGNAMVAHSARQGLGVGSQLAGLREVDEGPHTDLEQGTDVSGIPPCKQPRRDPIRTG